MGVGTSRLQLELELERKNAELVALQARVDALEAQANAPVLPDFVASSLVPVGSQALLGSGLGAKRLRHKRRGNPDELSRAPHQNSEGDEMNDWSLPRHTDTSATWSPLHH